MGRLDVAAPRAIAGGDAGTSERGELLAAFAAVRARLGLVLLLFAIAGVAWWATVQRMAGMDASPGADLGALGWFVVTWVVMMAAMMFPAVAPTVALYGRMTHSRDAVRPLLFTAAYLLTWSAAGVLAYGLFEAGQRVFGSGAAWSTGGHWLAAGVLALAAVYELTPAKNVCLTKCQTPLGFLLGRWRDGRAGALSMGARHAGWCLGCCWALMAALFALGVMSLAWMAVVAALITIEKTVPWRRAVTWGTAGALAVLAVLFAVAPHAFAGSATPGMGM